VDYPTEGHTDAEHLIARLRDALSGPLPGIRAQQEMAPTKRQQPERGDDLRQSAVLALLHGHADLPGPAESAPTLESLSLVFTLRPNSLRHHAGQISFPGGGVEPQDRSLALTALRETAEELGIPTDKVRILGKLTPLHIAPSHNCVHPFVGWLPHLPPINPDPVEVSEVLDVSLEHLLNASNRGTLMWYRDGEALTAPSFKVITQEGAELRTENSGIHIWGATAMILSELLTIIRLLKSEA
jgi:8-oxo-dGTP pyrophosphatase MutT (NUDIX family)